MNEHSLMLNTIWLVAFGFFLKSVIFGIASGIMIYQRGTSRLAHAVKWFFIVMTLQDIAFSILYGMAYYEALDDRSTVFDVFWRNTTRITGVVAIFLVGIVGAWFIWVLSTRVRALIDFEERERDES